MGQRPHHPGLPAVHPNLGSPAWKVAPSPFPTQGGQTPRAQLPHGSKLPADRGPVEKMGGWGAPLPPRQGLGCGMMTSTRPERSRPVPQTTAFRNAVTSASQEQRNKAATAGSGNHGASRRRKQRKAAVAWHRRRHLGRRPTAALQAHDLPQAAHAGPPSVAQEKPLPQPSGDQQGAGHAPEHPPPQSPAWSRGPFSHTQTAPGLVRPWPRHREGKGTVPRNTSSSGMERWKAVVDVISPGYTEG